MADELTDPTPDESTDPALTPGQQRGIVDAFKNYKPSAWKGTAAALAVRPGDIQLDPEVEGRLYWDSVQRTLEGTSEDIHGKIHTWHNPDGTVTMTANQGNQELADKYGTPANPVEGALYGKLPWPKLPIPTAEELDVFAEDMGGFFDMLDAEAPELANMLEKNPRLLFTIPELYSQLSNTLGDYGPAMAVADYLAADLNVISYENWSTASSKGLPTATLFQEIAPLLSQRELDILATVWAGQWEDDNQQDRLAGLAYRWLHPGGGVERDLRDEATRAEFISYVYEAGSQQQSFGADEQTGWGRFFEWTDRPREIVTGAVRDAWNFFATAGNPQEAAMRSELSIGQTMAWSMGYDPSEKGWQNASGFVDASSFIWGDPINLLVGAGLAAKMGKTVAVAEKVAAMTFRQRLVYSAKSLLPQVGRSLTTLPRGSRAPSVRFFHNLFGRTADELFLAAKENGVWTDMFKIMNGKRGLAGLIEKYPQMEPLVDGAAAILRKAKTPEEFAEVVDELRHGDWLGEDSAGFLRTMEELNELKKTRNSKVAQILQTGDIPLQSLGKRDGVNVARTGVWVGEATEGSILLADDLVGDGAEKIVLAGKVRRQKVNQSFLNRVIKWSNQLRKEAFGTAGLLTDEQVKGLEDALKLSKGAIGDQAKPANLELLFNALSDNTTGFSLGNLTVGDTTAEVFMHMDTAGESAFIFKNADGKVIGGMQGLSEGAGFSWLDQGLRGQRFFNQFVEWAVDNPKIGASEIAEVLRLRGSDPNKTAAGAGAVSSQIRTLINKIGSTPEVNIVDSMVQKVLEGRIDRLGAEEMEMLMRFANQAGIDIIDFGNQGGILTGRGSEKVLKGQDRLLAEGEELLRATTDVDQEILRLEGMLYDIKAGNQSAWVIADFPTKITPEWKLSLRPWKKLATNDAKGWFGQFRRTQAAKSLMQAHGKTVSLTNLKAGGTELRRFLAEIGASRQFVADSLNELYAAARTERYETVANILVKAGEEIEHPLLAHALEQITDKGGVFSYGMIDGQEVAIGASRTREGVKVALPYMPTQLTDGYQLPGAEFMKGVTRYRQAKNIKTVFGGKAGEGLVKGLTKETGNRRKRLVEAFKTELLARGADVSAIGDDELYMMAYAKATDSGLGTGLGMLARNMDRAAWPFRQMHSFFTTMQLATRPTTWMMRVALLEEGIRAQFFDLPSFYAHPIRYVAKFNDGVITLRVGAHRAKFLNGVSEVVGKMVPRGTEFSPGLVEAIIQNIPEYGEWLGGKTPQGIHQLRSSLATFMQGAMENVHILDGFDRAGYIAGSTMKKQAKKIDKANQVLDRIGLKRDFDWGVDAADILNHGFISMMEKQVGAGAHVIEYLPGQMTNKQMAHYANAWAQQILRHTEDPIMGRFGLGRVAARADGLKDGGWDADALLRTKAWSRMEPTVRRIAEEANWFGGRIPNELELADRYLTEIVDKVVDQLFRPLLGDDPVEAGRIAGELRATKGATLADGTAWRVTGSNHGKAQETLREWAILNEGKNLPFPERVSGMMDPKMFFNEDANPITQTWQKFTSQMMRWFGEDATQILNRRPAWLAAYADNYQYYTETLGLTPEVAREMASTKASEIVNYVFYNLDNGSPYLKAMNRNIPFFGAFWEVSQTWAYKIPMAHNSIASAPALVRKLDRAFTALEALGLVERENQWNDDGTIKEATMYLTFDEDPHTGTQLGGLLSKAGHAGLSLPRTLVRAMVELRNLLSENDVDIDDEGFFKDKIMFQIGNPLATAGEQSHGIMAVNQIYLGMDPLKSFLLNKVRTKIGFAADTQLLDAQEGESLLELADRMDADVNALIRDNPANLRDKLGADGYAQLLRGTLRPEDVMLDGTEYFEIPDSSFIDQWMDQFIFPFGVEDSAAGMLYTLTPSWFPYFARGMGLWHSSGNPDNWTALNEDGTVKMPDDTIPLLEIVSPPASKMQIVGEINKQLLHLEASEGLISRWKSEVEALESMTQEVEKRGLKVIEIGGAKVIENVTPDPVFADKWKDQQLFVEQMNAQILKRAIDNAGGALVFRGIAGLMSPGNPRTLFEEEKLVEQYWDAKDLAAGNIRGSANWKLPDTLEEFEMRQNLVSEFIADESGDQAKDWFKKTYPEISVFTNARSFWTPGGKAPEIDSIDAYFEAVDAGLRAPIPPSILMTKMSLADITVAKHLELDRLFDPDNEGPWQAAANIVNDWTTYKQVLDEASVAYAGIDWYDQEVNGGEYDEWKRRNAGDSLTLAEEVTRRYDRVAETLDYLEEFSPSPDMSDKDRRAYVNALKNAARGFRDFIGDWNKEIEGTYLDSPREQALNWYFDTVQAPYYEKLAELYDSVDAAIDSEDQSRIYEEIRQFTSKEFQRKYYSVGGVEFPNALEFSWNKKPAQEQADRTLRWMANKPEWLGLEATTRLVQQSPGLAKYLPSTPQDFKIYEEYNATLTQLADDREPDANGNRLLTDSQYTKAKKRLDEQFRQAMIAENRLAELAYLDMYPIERLSLAGILPPELEPYAEMAVGIKQELARIDKTPGSQAGQKLFDQIYIRLEDAIQRDPRLWTEVLGPLLDVMYDKRTLDTGFGALFWDDRFGEV